MTTSVKTQKSFIEDLKSVLEMEYEALEGYESVIQHLQNEGYKSKLNQFHADHERHVKALKAVLKKHNESAPLGPAAKHMLPKSKQSITHFSDDKKLLRALQENDKEVLTAYHNLYENKERLEDSESILNKALKDEKKHGNWIEKTLKASAAE